MRYETATDREALSGFMLLTRLEGIMPALEPAHAIGYLPKLLRRTRKKEIVALCLSGRGDKDIGTIQTQLSHRWDNSGMNFPPGWKIGKNARKMGKN